MACYNCLCSTYLTSTFPRKFNRPKSSQANPRVLDEYLPSKQPNVTQDWKRKTLYARFNESQVTKERTFDNYGNQITTGSWVTFVKHYTPVESKDELKVFAGLVGIVNHIRGDWAYVKLHGSFSRGYVPLSYCKKYESKKNIHINITKTKSDSNCDETTPAILNKHSYFSKRAYGPRLLVLYDFEAEAEDDLSVAKGEFVRLLNSDDMEWLWVKNSRNEEGFVPRSFVNEHVCEDCRRYLFRRPSSQCSESEISTSNQTPRSSLSSASGSGAKSTIKDSHRTGVIKSSELLVRCNYKARKSGELSICKGDIVKANLKDQVAMETGWVWVYSPENRRSGYVPEYSVETTFITEI